MDRNSRRMFRDASVKLNPHVARSFYYMEKGYFSQIVLDPYIFKIFEMIRK